MRITTPSPVNWPIVTIAASFAGFFLVCAFYGRVVSRDSHFDRFTRFFLPIQPQTQYYPTASQLLVTAQRLAPPEKVLVLIGGNSVFRGTGQNRGELWSNYLQDLLGRDYQVVNFSIDQGGMESFAAVAYRILSASHPKIIYVGTADHRGFDVIDGLEAYKYIFWDAYYKRLFILSPEEQAAANEVRRHELRSLSGWTMHFAALADQVTYISSLRNELAYRFVSPDWTTNNLEKPFRARKYYRDSDSGQPIGEIQAKIALDRERAILMEGRLTAAVANLLDPASAQPRVAPGVLAMLAKSYDRTFSREHRERIVGVFLPNNPRTLAHMSDEARTATLLWDVAAAGELAQLGYTARVAGLDFTADDFVDEGHLMPSGGQKLAVEIAGEVKALAQKLQY